MPTCSHDGCDGRAVQSVQDVVIPYVDDVRQPPQPDGGPKHFCKKHKRTKTKRSPRLFRKREKRTYSHQPSRTYEGDPELPF